MIPNIDGQIGINVYSTKFKGLGGKIRLSPEDFQVFEILSEKSIKSIKQQDGYAVFKLRKQNIDTNHALADIFRKKRIRLKALGLKDSSAITEQYVCSNNKGNNTSNFSSTRYSLEHIGFVKKPLSKKDMIANHFKIRIHDCKDGIADFSEQNRILNFYGYQRFGSKRPVTHLIGKAILQKKFKKAVDLLVSSTSPY
ncbi:MAG: tRNA pseudouridine(13) synthase TruD, partial [Nitrosarchaeum sp.]|nr:tRNA pseudouridine(13) synthase TruD [Nitrosarchaeum sp.]